MLDSSELRQQIIAEARTWIGTPWHNNQSKKGIGCDCVNLPYGVYRVFDSGLPPIENYNRRAKEEKLLNRLDQYAQVLGVVEDRYPWSDRYSQYSKTHEQLLSVIGYGDIMVYSRDVDGAPGHLAMRTDKGKIEALYEFGVTETSLGNEYMLLAGYTFFDNSCS